MFRPDKFISQLQGLLVPKAGYLWRAVLGSAILLFAVILFAPLPPKSSLPASEKSATSTQPEPAKPLLVFAAASLKNALDEISEVWLRETGQQLRLSYAGSSRLARQIRQGAPAAIFISANSQWMDDLEHEDLLQPETRRNLLNNRLVLITHVSDELKNFPNSLGSSEILSPEKLKAISLNMFGEKLAVALTAAVPAGIYAKAALISLGQWQALKPSIIETSNVRAALHLVSQGEARYGIVYRTDIAMTDNVREIGEFPQNSHPQITYPAAIIREPAKNIPTATKFLEFLSSNKANEIFIKHGFLLNEQQKPN